MRILILYNIIMNTLKNKLNNKYFDIGYIDGANHSYYGKEDVLTDEICGFLKEIYWQIKTFVLLYKWNKNIYTK